jgi:hypothetical protein
VRLGYSDSQLRIYLLGTSRGGRRGREPGFCVKTEISFPAKIEAGEGEER